MVLDAVLEQVYNGKIEPLGYFSKSRQGSQIRYSTFDLEFFRLYLNVQTLQTQATTGMAKKNCTLRQNAITFFFIEITIKIFYHFFTTIYCVAV